RHGMNGCSERPEGFTPLRSVRRKSASVHLPMPVAGSGVRLEGLAGNCFGGRGTPAKRRFLSGSERIPARGVWHSAQSARCCERYPPYAALGPRGGAVTDIAGAGRRKRALPSLKMKFGLCVTSLRTGGRLFR